jgi:type II secretory pathway pseudopilin PulG
VGLPQVSGWAQVAANSNIQDREFICAFCVDGDNAANIGRALTESILTFEPKNIEDALHFFEQLEESCHDQNAKFCGSAVYLDGKETAFFALRGAVVLKRGPKVGQLLTADDQLRVIMGKRQIDDVIVLATQTAASFLPEIEQKFKAGFDTDTIITSTVPGIHDQDNSSLVSLAFIISAQELAAADDWAEIDQELESMSSESTLSASDLSGESKGALADYDGSVKPIEVKKPDQRKANNLLLSLWLIFKAVLFGLFKLLKSIVAKMQKILNNKQDLGIYQTESKRKKRIILAISLIIGLAILVFFVMMLNSRRAAELSEVQARLEPIRAQIAQAEAGVAQNPIESRQQAQSAVQILEALLVEVQNSKKSSATIEVVEETLSIAKATQTAISGQVELNSLESFYDLRLVSSDFVTSMAMSRGSTALFFDQQKKLLIILNLENKNVRSLNIDLAVRSLTMTSEQAFILADGIYSLDLTDEAAQPTRIIDEGDSNREASLIHTYETYLYVFNGPKRNIYRYSRQSDADNEYSEPIGWMQAARGLEYDSVASMTIDGDLWLSTTTGQIFKLAGGATQDFEVIGMTNSFETLIKVATDVDQQRIYVLEQGKRRVVTLEKNGTFIKEVVSSSLAAATDIFVSESLGQAFAVSGSIVYSIPL